MRMIEQLGVVLARVLFKKENKQYAEAEQEVNQGLIQLLGIDPNLVDSLPVEAILELTRFENRLDAEKGIVLAELTLEKARLKELTAGFGVSFLYYIKALHFYLAALESSEYFRKVEYIHKINQVIARLDQYEIPVDLKFRLIGYYEIRGFYSRAEDVLFELVEADYPDIRQAGTAFLNRLSAKTDAELEQGNLPRDEVEEALNELQI